MDATTWLWAAIAAGVLAVLYGIVSMTADPAAAGRQCPHAGDRRGRSRPAPRRISTASTPRSSSSASCCSWCSASPWTGRPPAASPSARALRRHRLHRHEHLGARQRAHRRGRHARASTPPWRSRSAAAPSPACWWSGWRCSGVAGYFAILLPPHRHGAGAARAGGPRLRRLADLDLRAPRRRHLHQGRRRGRRPGRQGRSRHPRGRPAQPGRDRRQRRRQRR